MSECQPVWFQQGLECPYGTAVPFFDVTIPKNASPWQVVGIAYGFVPWILCFMILLVFLIKRGTREFSVGLLPLLVAVIVLIVKLLARQIRPEGSCLSSCGMPSAHAATSTALFLYLILDAAHRVVAPPKGIMSFFPSLASVGETCVALFKGVMMFPFGAISQREFSAYLAIWSPLLLPVPISRALLSDHSASQILSGCLIGILACFLWYPAILALRLKFANYYGRKFWYIFVHNYDVPEGWATVRLEDDSKSTSADAPLVSTETTTSEQRV
jgi:membrane-associated phospholipid phosphatase